MHDAQSESIESLQKQLVSLSKELTEAQEEIVQLKKAQAALEERNRGLEELAVIDSLTKIPNRRFFCRELERGCLEAKRRQEPVSVIIIDIDYFKQYNDHYGHLQGDYVLKQVASALKKTLYRPTDSVARYGGEEFAIVLPNTNGDGVQITAERIRMAVENLQIPHSESEAAKIITISLGIATFPEKLLEEPSAIELFGLADQRLYQAKKCGRNRVCCICY